MNLGAHIKLILSAFVALFAVLDASAQVDYFQLTGVSPNYMDTLAYQNLQRQSQQSAGLLEKAIQPSKYILGPGDELVISIVSARSRQLLATVYPDGNITIPEAGTVSVSGITLDSARARIIEKLETVFNAREISVALGKIRQFKVTVAGAIPRPSIVTAGPTDRVSEIIDRAGGLKYFSSIRNIRLSREGATDERVDLLRFYMLGESEFNPCVLGGDRIMVPQINNSAKIQISGEVLSAGTFEYVEGDRLFDLIRFAGGFTGDALVDSVEFVRYDQSGNSINKRILNLRGMAPSEDFALQPGDRVYVRKIAVTFIDRYVSISGEVKYPGRYAIDEQKTKITDLLALAGGLTQNANPDQSVLIRRSAYNYEDKIMSRLSRLRPSEMTEAEKQYFNAKVNERYGAMALDFEKIFKDKNSPENLYLINLDSLFVPKPKTYVSVQGSVLMPGLVHYQKGMTYLDYIAQCGGFGYRAEKSDVRVIKPRGEEYIAKKENYEIEAGDEIIVPQESDSKFLDTFLTALTITTQVLTIVGVFVAFSKMK